MADTLRPAGVRHSPTPTAARKGPARHPARGALGRDAPLGIIGRVTANDPAGRQSPPPPPADAWASLPDDSWAELPLPESPPPALDYAGPSRPGLLRRALRWWPIWALVVAAGFGVAYGPGVWRHVRLMRLQAACLSADLPRDRPVLETDRAAAAALVAAGPPEYSLDLNGVAVRRDPRWAALAAELGLPPWPGHGPGYPMPTVFCGERFTPSGARRLVVLEGFDDVTVIEPAGWGGGRPRVVWRARVRQAAAFDRVGEVLNRLVLAPGASPSAMAGVPDPADRSRFTMSAKFNGVPATVEFRLGDDDQVTQAVVDEPGFTARAVAARDAYWAAMEKAAATRRTR